MLDAATLSDSNDLYPPMKKFSYQGLEARLEELNECDYSALQKSLIRNMCSVDPTDRMRAVELYRWLAPHEVAINNFEEFTPSEPPFKVARPSLHPQVAATFGQQGLPYYSTQPSVEQPSPYQNLQQLSKPSFPNTAQFGPSAGTGRQGGVVESNVVPFYPRMSL